MKIKSCNCGGEVELLTEKAFEGNVYVGDLFYIQCGCEIRTKGCTTYYEALEDWNAVMGLNADVVKVLEGVANMYKPVTDKLLIAKYPNHIRCGLCGTWGKDKNDMHHSAVCIVPIAERILRDNEKGKGGER